MRVKDFADYNLKYTLVLIGLVLPLTIFLSVIFILVFNLENLLMYPILVVGTPIFVVAIVVWWRWLMWLLRQYQRIVDALIEARRELTELRQLIKETFTNHDK